MCCSFASHEVCVSEACGWIGLALTMNTKRKETSITLHSVERLSRQECSFVCVKCMCVYLDVCMCVWIGRWGKE